MSSSLHGVLHVIDSVTNKSRPLSLANNVLAVDNSANDQPIRAAALPLPAGAATDLSVQAITTALGNTLSVTQAVSKAETTLSSSVSVAPGDFSSAHDARNHRKIAIFGETTNFSDNIDVYVSQDNSTYYKMGQFSMYPDSSGKFGMVIDAPFKYIKLGYLGIATVTAIAAGSN